MADLLKALRTVERGDSNSQWLRNPDGPEAADEIESLRKRLADTQNELAEMRVDVERLAAKVRYEKARADFNDSADELRELRERVALLEAQRDR